MVARAGGRGLRHAAMLYRTADELAAQVSGFVREGVSAGEPVLVAATGSNLHRLRAHLDGLGELVSFSDMTQPLVNPRRVMARLRSFAAAHRGQPVRCVQAPTWDGQPRDEVRQAIRHEPLVNLALASYPAMVLCVYHAGLDAEVLAGVERSHPLVMREGIWQPSPAHGGDALSSGEEPLSDPPATAQSMRYRDDLEGVRRFAAEYARNTSLADDRIMDLIIAIGELTANTLAHTQGPGTCTIWTACGELICQIRDEGKITDPFAGTRPHGPQETDFGGHGLWIVSQVCDLVEVRCGPGGTTVRVHMRFAGPAPPPR